MDKVGNGLEWLILAYGEFQILWRSLSCWELVSAWMLQPEKLQSREPSSKTSCFQLFSQLEELNCALLLCLRRAMEGLFLSDAGKKNRKCLSFPSNLKRTYKAFLPWQYFATSNLPQFSTGYKNHLYFNKHDDWDYLLSETNEMKDVDKSWICIVQPEYNLKAQQYWTSTATDNVNIFTWFDMKYWSQFVNGQLQRLFLYIE